MPTSKRRRLPQRSSRWDASFSGERETPVEFFAKHPYFHVREFLQTRKPAAAHRALHYHVTQKRLVSPRKGTYLWASLRHQPDPYLLGTRLAEASEVSHASALRFHHLLPPHRETLTFFSRTRVPEFTYAGITFRSVKNIFPDKEFFGRGASLHFRAGLPLTVSDPSRAFVDCLDRLDLAPELDTLWAVFREQPRLDVKVMVDYALSLNNRVTAARVGLFLDRHPRSAYLRPDLRRLMEVIPARAAPMVPGDSPKRTLRWPRWNLLVPARLFHRLENPRAAGDEVDEA
ncbi:MAG: hypothetical protein IPJ65_35440 [Archangiaceae bacterium]|nr:hypothetical protein [Archangiaceae bacterium]